MENTGETDSVWFKEKTWTEIDVSSKFLDLKWLHLNKLRELMHDIVRTEEPQIWVQRSPEIYFHEGCQKQRKNYLEFVYRTKIKDLARKAPN